MPEDTEVTPELRIKKAFESEIPQVYFNGFVNNLGIGDIVTILERNGNPVTVLNMSYTTAKTLALSLGKLIAELEEKTGREMLTTHDVGRLLSSKGEDE